MEQVFYEGVGIWSTVRIGTHFIIALANSTILKTISETGSYYRDVFFVQWEELRVDGDMLANDGGRRYLAS